MTTAIKICGITSVVDARMVSQAGADYLGVLLNVRQSPRSVDMNTASRIIEAATGPVIVLAYDHSIDDLKMIQSALSPSGVQLAGNESYSSIEAIRGTMKGELWKTVHLPVADPEHRTLASLVEQIKSLFQLGVDKIVLDTALMQGNIMHRGGTGSPCDWSLAAQIKERVPGCLFLAGGINPDNVKNALLQVRPDGIDVSSGVELSAGKKDHSRVTRLIESVKTVQ